jgi:hypothetical protein
MRKIVALASAALLALCAGAAAMASPSSRAALFPDWNTADTGLVLSGMWESTDVVTGSGLPITLTGCSYRTILRTQVPAQPGDALDVTANARVTDDASEPRYNTGITWNFAYYDVDNGLGSSGTWYGFGTSQGENVTPDTHHLSMGVDRTLKVPDTWTPGHRIAVVLRACAESTAARSGDAVTVDPLGELIVLRWTAPTPA